MRQTMTVPLPHMQPPTISDSGGRRGHRQQDGGQETEDTQKYDLGGSRLDGGNTRKAKKNQKPTGKLNQSHSHKAHSSKRESSGGWPGTRPRQSKSSGGRFWACSAELCKTQEPWTCKELQVSQTMNATVKMSQETLEQTWNQKTEKQETIDLSEAVDSDEGGAVKYN